MPFLFYGKIKMKTVSLRKGTRIKPIVFYSVWIEMSFREVMRIKLF